LRAYTLVREAANLGWCGARAAYAREQTGDTLVCPGQPESRSSEPEASLRARGFSRRPAGELG